MFFFFLKSIVPTCIQLLFTTSKTLFGNLFRFITWFYFIINTTILYYYYSRKMCFKRYKISKKINMSHCYGSRIVLFTTANLNLNRICFISHFIPLALWFIYVCSINCFVIVLNAYKGFCGECWCTIILYTYLLCFLTNVCRFPYSRLM